ncbi:MAG: T9SS type A sorting domain-containing protein [Bacteroidetes bacterium]|nr:T9SS type A sorting domain-containing protein [Bacteroidota bacterium]
MHKLILIAVWSFALFSITTARSQTWQWAKSSAGHSNDYAGGLDIDEQGNSYIAGKFYDSVSFGATTLTSPGTWSVYIAKYDLNGGVLWAKSAGSAGNIKVTGICRDRFGNLSIVGQYSDSASFGTLSPTTLYSVAGYDVFIASYNADGDLRWARSLGDTGYDYGSAIHADTNGRLYITGDLHISSYNGSASQVFVACYDSSGTNTWMLHEPNYHNFHQGNDLAVSNDGTSYVAGQFFDTLRFSQTAVLGAGNIEANIFLMKVDKDGNIAWMQKGGAASGYTAATAVDVDTAGNTYITGFYHGTITLGTLSLNGPAGYSDDVFVAKCDSAGNYVWVNKASGPWNLDNGVHISSAKDGSIYVAGNFETQLTLDTITIYNSNQPDIFIARMDGSGHFAWADRCGGPTFDNMAGLRTNTQGIFLSGDFRGTGHFGPSLTANSDSTSDIFVARITMDSVESVRNTGRNVHTLLFPNPAATALYIKDAERFNSYTITDISGKAILSNYLYGKQGIKITDLVCGVYLIKLVGKDGSVQTLKFTKN